MPAPIPCSQDDIGQVAARSLRAPNSDRAPCVDVSSVQPAGPRRRCRRRAALEPPPAIPQPTGARWQQLLSVLPMLAGTVATAMMFGGREGASAYTYVVGGIFGLSTLGMLVTNWGGASGPRKAELMQARRDYLRYLAGLPATGARRRSPSSGTRSQPPPSRPAGAVGRGDGRRGSGSAGRRDGDFGVVRVGVGPQSLAHRAGRTGDRPDGRPRTGHRGRAAAVPRHVLVVPDLPISVAIRSFTRVVVTDARRGPGAARWPGRWSPSWPPSTPRTT